MMQKLWLKKPALQYSKNVLDIVQFGSSVFEGKTPHDIDIAVIFKALPLKNQLHEAQDIKKQIERIEHLDGIPIHINSFDLYTLFDPSNFAKENILFYGKSIIHGDNFSKRFGLISRLHIYYSLEKLKKKDKIRFNYMLNGKSNAYGLLRKYGGHIVKPGLVEIEPAFEFIFADAIKNFSVHYEIKRVLMEKK